RLATRPVYDFLAYHAVAQQLASGAGLSALEALDGRPWGYPLLLGGLYRLLGVNLLWPQLLNVLFSALAIIFLYHIVRRLAEPRLAVLAALVYALFPSQVLMNNVVNSEVVFIGLALGGVYYSLRFLDTLAVGDLVATGALLSLAHLVRPVGVLYLAVFLLVLLVQQGSRPLDYLKMAGVALLSFYLVLAPLLVLKSVAYGRPVFWEGGTFGIVFLMGTNMYHQGFWNQDDYAYVQSLKQQYGGDMGKVNDAAFDAAWRRLRANFAQIREMMPAKAYKMWSIDTFAFDWANRGGQDQWLVQDADARRWYYGVSQAFWASLWLGLLGFLVAFPLHRHREVNYLLLLFLAFFGLHLLIEIQGRYHMHLAPLLIAVAAVGMGSLWALKEREG
ncbi:MAG: glycosyltransferase family 39 protein, partial [Syntrophomonadaceae bacterium]|nr:glycosyltransferase family 39 protein [Syntrophomonadaceae bacterium]